VHEPLVRVRSISWAINWFGSKLLGTDQETVMAAS
jgi:hypothetical protein